MRIRLGRFRPWLMLFIAGLSVGSAIALYASLTNESLYLTTNLPGALLFLFGLWLCGLGATALARHLRLKSVYEMELVFVLIR